MTRSGLKKLLFIPGLALFLYLARQVGWKSLTPDLRRLGWFLERSSSMIHPRIGLHMISSRSTAGFSYCTVRWCGILSLHSAQGACR